MLIDARKYLVLFFYVCCKTTLFFNRISYSTYTIYLNDEQVYVYIIQQLKERIKSECQHRKLMLRNSSCWVVSHDHVS